VATNIFEKRKKFLLVGVKKKKNAKKLANFFKLSKPQN
jgi:hypothetical protein